LINFSRLIDCNFFNYYTTTVLLLERKYAGWNDSVHWGAVFDAARTTQGVLA